MGQFFPAFKAYDVRGKVPGELNADIAYRIGRAFADEIKPKTVCVGYDIRLSGPELYDAFARGLNDSGVDVVHLGLVGTEMVYFATAFYGYDGGCMITASHNPPEYNGMKMVRSESRPISSDSGLSEIERRAYEARWERSGAGSRQDKHIYDDFVEHLLGIVPSASLAPIQVLCDAGNGAAGLALNRLLPLTPIKALRRLFEPDGTFPNGVPNPILEESRAGTMQAIREADVDFGVAWDGDYDRCFFFDGKGEFIEGYYIVGLIAEAILRDFPGEKIVYDPRLTWNTIDVVKRHGGVPVICKSGHAFIKEKMRAEDAIYGGEMSAHHYFKQHWYCDSGMIPFLLVSKLVGAAGRPLGGMVADMIRNYPCSGEINSKVADVAAVLARVEAAYSSGNISHLDGLSVEFPDWRFNLRGSNTEPVIRLNVESRGDAQLMEAKTREILELVRS